MGNRKRFSGEYPVAFPVASYDDLDERYLQSHGAFQDNPERACGLKQAIESLSAEAKEVVMMVLNVPDELVDFIIGKGTYCYLTPSSVKEWLRWKGWHWVKIERVFAEVKAKLLAL